MSDFSVKVQKIFIKPHPNADALELGNIGHKEGWQVCVKKGQFRTGDLVVYIGENSVVPDWILKRYGFWNEEKDKGLLAGTKGNRVKAIRLRNEFSLGICLPTSNRPEPAYTISMIELENESKVIVDEGTEVAEILGVIKYEPPIPTQLAGEVFFAGMSIGVSYDVEDIKNYPDVLEDGEEVQMSVKIHGCADYDTLIETLEYGPIKIGKVVEEKLNVHVKSFNVNTNEILYSQVENYAVYPNDKQWFLIETEDGQKIKLTGNHKVWLPNLQCYREVEKLTEDDYFLID